MNLNHHFREAIRKDTKVQLTSLLKEQRRRLGLRNLHYFCKDILHYHDLTEEDGFHGDFCRHIQDDNKHLKLTLTPRGSLKSSVSTIGDSLRKVCINPNIRILIASKKFTNSVAYLSEIIGHIEKNDDFRDLYGDLVGLDSWTKTEIIVRTRTNWKKEPTISCAGIDVTKVGMHYDVIKLDDPQDEDNTRSQDRIDQVIRWYRLLYSLLDPGGYLDINGTIWHFNDLYNYIIAKENLRKSQGKKPRFSIFIRDSFKGTNEELLEGKIPRKDFLWPERLSPEFLQETLLEQGPYMFSCQYRLTPIDDESAKFKRSWIRTCKFEDIPKRLNIYSTVDPMVDEEGKDWLAITTVGMDNNWLGYLLDVRRLKADEHDTVDEMKDVYDKWKPLKIGIETVSFQKTYFRYVQILQMMKGFKLPIVQLDQETTKKKRLRILSMVPYWKAGLYIIPTVDGTLDSVDGNMKILVDELTRYPRVNNDDTIDALAYMNQLTRRPGVVHILAKINPKSFKAVRSKIIKRGKKGYLGRHNVRAGYGRNV